MTIYPTRYSATKQNPDAVIVRVNGGYTPMTRTQYATWRKQK